MRLAAFAAVLLAPAAALACPAAAASSCGSCGMGMAGTLSSVSLGVLLGVGSVAIENVVKRRRRP